MILIVAEQGNGKLSKSTYEMVTAARECGREGPVTLLVLGSGVVQVAAQAALLGDQVLVADLPALEQFDPEVWAAAVAQIAKEGEAHTILIGGSRSGRGYSSRVAVKLDAPLVEDAISLKYAGDVLEAEHYTYLARVTERVQALAPVIVATVKPGAFAPAQAGAEAVEQFDVELELPSKRVEVTERATAKSERVSLTEADIVVSGGRGLGSAEAFTELVEGLADQLGAAVGATRAIVDAGWRPYAEQVGQTGKTVQPKVYIAIGISGAVQHLSGMGKSKVIVAINRDRDAPIFGMADYGIVGDVKEIVPAILAKLKA
ncbi:electron transfer flavoprotein subunit alpha/FixB family protein [Granulicella tundricola]|uniref:Electron transfer flavoprotein subunit alpha n=1 Tax=Granulicella tundricola (strain ATCC BAA-1859 / DSM 23138 / MP5ACTX9) TaxID=1198114 RepID=E8X2K3_GRATM|nr:electron transfer flavoprotein subunit alpha/FixB family protein [Granulicella tundricola]ADW69227.1 Electron transfer flavoprotein alpha subunit [Granulicella tundricola MP5ACTX9]